MNLHSIDYRSTFQFENIDFRDSTRFKPGFPGRTRLDWIALGLIRIAQIEYAGKEGWKTSSAARQGGIEARETRAQKDTR